MCDSQSFVLAKRQYNGTSNCIITNEENYTNAPFLFLKVYQGKSVSGACTMFHRIRTRNLRLGVGAATSAEVLCDSNDHLAERNRKPMYRGLTSAFLLLEGLYVINSSDEIHSWFCAHSCDPGSGLQLRVGVTQPFVLVWGERIVRTYGRWWKDGLSPAPGRWSVSSGLQGFVVYGRQHE